MGTPTTEFIETFRDELKLDYSFIVYDPLLVPPAEFPTYTDIQIDSAIIAVYNTIPPTCIYFNQILEYLTLHHLLEEKRLKEAWESNDTSSPKDLENIKAIGDLSFKFVTGGANADPFDPFYDTTEYGKRAKILLKRCARQRVGIIV